MPLGVRAKQISISLVPARASSRRLAARIRGSLINLAGVQNIVAETADAPGRGISSATRIPYALPRRTGWLGRVDRNLCIPESKIAQISAWAAGDSNLCISKSSKRRNWTVSWSPHHHSRSGSSHHSRCGSWNPAAPTSQSVSNASKMKVAQKPRGTARFRRYELVSVSGIWQWRRHSGLLSQRAFFGVSFFTENRPSPRGVRT